MVSLPRHQHLHLRLLQLPGHLLLVGGGGELREERRGRRRDCRRPLSLRRRRLHDRRSLSEMPVLLRHWAPKFLEHV